MTRFLAGLPIIGRFFRRADAAPISLVMLLDHEPALGVVEVGGAVRAAYPAGAAEMLGEIPGPPGGPGATRGRNIMFEAEGGVFGVLIIPYPYTEDPDAVADGIDRADIAEAVRTHRGWVSVDTFGPMPRETAHRVIGRVAASLSPEGCLAFYMPHRQRFSFPTDTLRDAMREGDWLGTFDGVGGDRVVGREAGDEALHAAADEARRRFPEFAHAFEHEPASDFSVKAGFEEEGEVEHMWIAVDAVLPDGVRGRLSNTPRVLSRLREGDEITLPLDEIEDWMVMNQHGMRGGFSVRVIDPDLYRQMGGA